jgi:hypothetical protein
MDQRLKYTGGRDILVGWRCAGNLSTVAMGVVLFG